MGNSNSVYDNFDQAAWCDRHSASINPENVQGTFVYVRWQHPLFGCAKPPNKLPKWNGKESAEDLAKMADAVTRLCYKRVGQDSFKSEAEIPSTESLQSMNSTAVANLAFIALQHPNETIKQRAQTNLDAWRKTKS